MEFFVIFQGAKAAFWLIISIWEEYVLLVLAHFSSFSSFSSQKSWKMVKKHGLNSEGGAQQLFTGQNIQQLKYLLHTSITSVKKNRRWRPHLFSTPIIAAHSAFMEAIY